MKPIVYATAILFVAVGATAAVVSNGSIYQETFTGNTPDSGQTSAIGVGASYANEMGYVLTLAETEGVIRAGGLGIAANIDYVLEFDLIVHASSGDNFYVLYSEGQNSPWQSDIQLRAYADPDDGDWEFQVDYGSGQYDQPDLDLVFDVPYHITVHSKGSTTADVDLYVDDNLVGTYADRNSGLDVNIVQWGDPSSGGGYGEMSVDNIIIGLPVPPPTISLVDVTDAPMLSFDSFDAVRYELEYVTTPASSNWMSAGYQVTGDGGSLLAFDPSGTSTSRTYRLNVLGR